MYNLLVQYKTHKSELEYVYLQLLLDYNYCDYNIKSKIDILKYLYKELNINIPINNNQPNTIESIIIKESSKYNHLLKTIIGVGGYGDVYKYNKNNYIWTVKKIKIKNYKIYTECKIHDIINKINKQCFLKYYYTNIINDYCYISMEYAQYNLTEWSAINNNKYNWKSLICQIIIGYIMLLKNNIIHNDIRTKNILVNPTKNKRIEYSINNKLYHLETDYNFYIIDFGESYIYKDNIDKNIKDDLHYLSKFPNMIKAYHLTLNKKYDIDFF